MGKSIALVIAILAGGGLAAQSFQLSKKLDEQATELNRLRAQVVALDETVATSGTPSPAAIAAASFEIPEGSSDGGTQAIDDAELRALVEKMVRDDQVIGALATRITPRVDDAQALVNSDAFRTGVEETIAAIEEEERQERSARRQEQMVERTERRAQEIAEKLQLNNATAQELSHILVEGAQAMTDVWGLVRSGEIDRREIRDVMREQRDETNTLVSQILTPTQYEEYTKIQEEDRGGFGGFGGPGGRRGFGGGGGGQTPATNSGSGTTDAGNDSGGARTGRRGRGF